MQSGMHQGMQLPATTGASTPQRSSIGSQSTPSIAPAQPQFSTPAAPTSVLREQTPNANQGSNQQVHAQSLPTSATSVSTPQTPTFPSSGQGAFNGATVAPSTPRSPRTEAREKERCTVLLELNQELLYESLQLQNTLTELKKEQPSPNLATEQQAITHDYQQ